MSHRTVILSSYEDYLASEADSPEVRAEEERARQDRLTRFPYAVILKVSFPELDFANRWCWQRFGPSDGVCLQRQSVYPACDLAEPHFHTGRWMWYWLQKTEYDFGFCEWCFSEQSDREGFIDSVGGIHWGENYA